MPEAGKVDLHTHSTCSDGRLTPRELVRLAHRNGERRIAQGSVGRPHVAQALLEAGHVQTMAEAFDRFIGRNGPAYVERVKFTPEQAIELIHRVGGVAVMAHPREGKGTLHVLDGLVAAG